MANETDALKAEIAELRQDLDSLSATIREQIHGSMDANQPGIASRLQSVEGVIRRHDFPQIEQKIALLENNAVPDGQTRFAVLEAKVQRQEKISWTIGSGVILAIVSGLLGMIFKDG